MRGSGEGPRLLSQEVSIAGRRTESKSVNQPLERIVAGRCMCARRLIPSLVSDIFSASMYVSTLVDVREYTQCCAA